MTFGLGHPGVEVGVEVVNPARCEFDDLSELHDPTSVSPFRPWQPVVGTGVARRDLERRPTVSSQTGAAATHPFAAEGWDPGPVPDCGSGLGQERRAPA